MKRTPIELRSALALLAVAVHPTCFGQSAAKIYREAHGAVVVVSNRGGVGTGFRISGTDLVLTCDHVVADDPESVRVSDKPSRVLWEDESRDIALLLSPSEKGPGLRIATKEPDPGTQVFVIGTPLGLLDRSISDGIVSGLRTIEGIKRIQFTAPISEGSSGSPVISSKGDVIGVARSRFSEGQSLNFAVSCVEVNEVLRQFRASQKGKKVIAKLGQTVRDVGIHSKMSEASHIYYQCKEYEYLAVNPTGVRGWLSVVLQNGSKGYVPRDSVTILPYNVLRDPINGSHANLHPTLLGSDGMYAIVADIAKLWLDTPYLEGGSTKSGVGNGELIAQLFPDSGLTSDIALQAGMGRIVPRISLLRPGDRLYFSEITEGPIRLAAIFVGDNSFIWSTPGAGEVTQQELNEHYRTLLVSARR